MIVICSHLYRFLRRVVLIDLHVEVNRHVPPTAGGAATDVLDKSHHSLVLGGDEDGGSGREGVHSDSGQIASLARPATPKRREVIGGDRGSMMGDGRNCNGDGGAQETDPNNEK